MVRFEDLGRIKNEMLMISSTFTCSVDNAPSDVQLELIELQTFLSQDHWHQYFLFLMWPHGKNNCPPLL